MMKKLFLLASFIFLIGNFGFSQTYNAGETYFGANDYIEYKAGNLPIIISAPHGGVLEPNDIPDRDCTGCVYVRDTNTEDLIRKMHDAIFERFGCYPHVIINRLHRRKLDANRAIGDAADGNAIGEQAWNDFHDFINSAKDSVEVKFGKGIYLDLHGHGHEVQRLELGYLLSKTELMMSDMELNDINFVNDASIKNLVNNNVDELNLPQLLRGEKSFGQLYELENYPAVPSMNDPYPLSSESYFSGGYNTNRHGSIDEGTIDAIQIECNMEGVRDTDSNRSEFANATASVLEGFLEKHYFGSNFFVDLNCSSSSSIENSNQNYFDFLIYPNPVKEVLNLKLSPSTSSPISISIFNQLGQNVFQKKYSNQNKIEVLFDPFPKGIYFLKMETSKNAKTKKFFKK